MKNKIFGVILTCLFANNAKAQIDYNKDGRAALLKVHGTGAPSNNKFYMKYVQLIDAESKKPVANHYLTFYKGVTAIGSGKTNENGYAMFGMRNSNYYNKLTVDVNPNVNNPHASNRNKIVYVALNDGKITLPSKKEIIDTVKVYVRKTK